MKRNTEIHAGFKYYSLTRGVGGQTRSRFLSPEEAQRAREQIATGQQFRRQVEAYWGVCEQGADAQLEAREEEGQAKVKKNRNRRGPRARLRR